MLKIRDMRAPWRRLTLLVEPGWGGLQVRGRPPTPPPPNGLGVVFLEGFRPRVTEASARPPLQDPAVPPTQPMRAHETGCPGPLAVCHMLSG